MRIFQALTLFFVSLTAAHADQYEFVDNFTTEAISASGQIVTVSTSVGNYQLHLTEREFGQDIEWVNTEVPGTGDIRFFQGYLVDAPDVWARVTITGQRFYGLLKINNEYLTLSNYRKPQLRFDSPVNLAEQAVKQRVQSYTDLGFDNPWQVDSAISHVLPISIVIDDLYNSENNGEGVSAALAIVNATDGILRENLGLALRVESMVLATDEEFSNLPGATSSQLSAFREFSRTIPSVSDSGIVYLFTGSAPDDPSIAIGRGYIGAVCSSYLNVGVSVDWWRNEAPLMAHELGHNLGARHDNGGSCDDGTWVMTIPIVGATVYSQCSSDAIRASMESKSCFLEVVDVSLAARRVDNTVIFQITNLNQANDLQETLDLDIQLDASSVSKLPGACSVVVDDEIECLISGVFAGETIDLSFEVNAGVSGIVGGYIQGSQGYEEDTSDNYAQVDLADTTTNDTNGLCIDADGDGFGWNGTASCRTDVPIRESTEERPEYINAQTGIPVNFVQAYWNTAEFVGQSVECTPNYWNSKISMYAKEEAFITRYLHSLADGQTSSGTVQVASFALTGEDGDLTGGTTIEEFPWSIEDGRYIGPMPIERSSYVQIVDEGEGRVNATRSWTSNISFDLCRSFPDSADFFVPSGTFDVQIAGTCVDTPPRGDGFGWNGIETCSVDPDRDVTGSRSLIVNSVVGNVAIDGVLDEPLWQSVTQSDTANNDLQLASTLIGLDVPRNPVWFVGHDATHLYIAVRAPDDTPFSDSQNEYWHDDSVEIFFDGGFQRNKRYDDDDSQIILRNNGERTGVLNRPVVVDFARTYNSVEAEYIYEVKVLKSSINVGADEFGIEVQINNDQDGAQRDSKVGWSAVEGTDSMWYDMSNIGHACFDNGSAIDNCSPGASVSLPVDDCVDTAPLNDGWGWNGTSSCRVDGPQDTLQPVEQPTDQPPSTECVDTDPVGDGWGWNGSESCLVGGLNPVEDTTNECIDTDPIGDGWGWNGSGSCRVDDTGNECIDTDPVGDGWGWDGIGSCRVESAVSTPPCVDTNPVGDGWGWDGSESCRVQ